MPFPNLYATNFQGTCRDGETGLIDGPVITYDPRIMAKFGTDGVKRRDHRRYILYSEKELEIIAASPTKIIGPKKTDTLGPDPEEARKALSEIKNGRVTLGNCSGGYSI